MAFTFNGIGTKFFGKSDEQLDGSYTATEWLVFLYFPLIPIRSFRLRPVSGGTYAVVYASQKFQAQRIPLQWKQVRSMYLLELAVALAFCGILIAIVGLPL